MFGQGIGLEDLQIHFQPSDYTFLPLQNNETARFSSELFKYGQKSFV